MHVAPQTAAVVTSGFSYGVVSSNSAICRRACCGATRAATINDQFGSGQYASESAATLDALITIPITGVTPGTFVTIDYQWAFFLTAGPPLDDPELASARSFNSDFPTNSAWPRRRRHTTVSHPRQESKPRRRSKRGAGLPRSDSHPEPGPIRSSGR